MNERTPTSPGFFRRLCSPRRLRRLLFLLAMLITLVGLFYTEENWRGKRAWARYKQEAAARGINTDWNASIPAAVPDDQNFFKAPNMQKWFVGRGTNDLSRLVSSRSLDESLLRRGRVPSVVVTVVPANAPVAPADADLVLQYNPPLLSLADSSAAAAAGHAPNVRQGRVKISPAVITEMTKSIGPKMDAFKLAGPLPLLTDVNGRKIVLTPLPIVPPLRMVVRAAGNPTTNEIEDFLPSSLFVKPGNIVTGSNTIRAALVNSADYVAAADFLEWSDSFKDEFDTFRAALDRPCARMDGAYENPPYIPIPNFVCMRLTSQMLARRAQCYLLLGEPDKALGELTDIHKLCRVLEGRPTGKPVTLVAAMINVAIRGLYVDIVADGLRLHAWREPQLVALQQQLAMTDLLPIVREAFYFEFVSFGRTVEINGTRELAKLFGFKTGKGVWESLRDPAYLLVVLAPHGWLYQNAITDGLTGQESLESFDLTNHLVFPQKVDRRMHEVEAMVKYPRPYNYLAFKAIPNYRRAKQVAAYKQTLVNEAQIACALERYRLVNGRYPESLAALAPKFAETLPHDLIGGGPLKYRVEGASFVLYSIGWNETDDGGVTDRKGEQTGDLSKKDWTWLF